MIAVQVEPERDLTVVTIAGKLVPDLIGQVLRQKNFGTTSRVLWDLRRARLSDLDQENMAQIAGRIRPSMETRATRCTAVIAGDPVAKTVIEEYFTIAQRVFGQPVPLFATTSRVSAMAWLDEIAPPVG